MFTIGEVKYLALAGSSAIFLRGFHSSKYSHPIQRVKLDWKGDYPNISFRIQGSHLLWPTIPGGSPKKYLGEYPRAFPFSLAATQGIPIGIFSSRY